MGWVILTEGHVIIMIMRSLVYHHVILSDLSAFHTYTLPRSDSTSYDEYMNLYILFNMAPVSI